MLDSFLVSRGYRITSVLLRKGKNSLNTTEIYRVDKTAR